jgi:hypothetical protein
LKKLLWVVLLFACSAFGQTHFADGGPTTETPEPAASFMVVSGLALIGLGRVRRGPR